MALYSVKYGALAPDPDFPVSIVRNDGQLGKARQGKARQVPNGQVRLLIFVPVLYEVWFLMLRERGLSASSSFGNRAAARLAARRLNISVICSAKYHRWQK